MSYTLVSLFYAAALFIGMVALQEVGRRVARRRAKADPEGAWQGIGVVDGVVFGLLGLIVAFSFSGAVSRFDARRNLIVEETNTIGTAYLRLDVLPSHAQPALRESFRRYVDSRIQTYRLFPDVDAIKAELGKAQILQGEIWTSALAATRESQPATMLLLPALNQMFDIATTRTLTMMMHPPAIIFVMIFGLSLVSALLVGYGMAKPKSRHWLHIIGFAAVTSFAFYVILDVEYPRLGVIRVDALDQALVDLRNSMN